MRKTLLSKQIRYRLVAGIFMIIISVAIVSFSIKKEYIRSQSLKIIKEISAFLRDDYEKIVLNDVTESSTTIILSATQQSMLSENYPRIFSQLSEQMQFSIYPKGTRYNAFPAFSINISDVDYKSCKNWIFDLVRKTTVYKIEEVVLINEKMQKTLSRSVSLNQLGRWCEKKNTVSLYFKF